MAPPPAAATTLIPLHNSTSNGTNGSNGSKGSNNQHQQAHDNSNEAGQIGTQIFLTSTEGEGAGEIRLKSNLKPSQLRHVEPLKQTGILDQFDKFDVTPVIGREFRNVDLAAWLNDEKDGDALIRDLGITIAERGVVFFRAQDNLTTALQKQLIHRLGQLTGRPASSGLHIHPLMNNERSDGIGGDDPEISTISSKFHSAAYDRRSYASQAASGHAWHSDVSFEKVPADFSSLRLEKLPASGGDTIWASGYEVYDRISPPLQKFLESLSVTFEQPEFAKAAAKVGQKLYTKPRGSSENVGSELRAQHPVVRTNPITGWKSVFPIGAHVSHIDDVSEQESKWILEWLLSIVHTNHGLQVRFKWENPNDIAIWDNRSVLHSAIADYYGLGERFGVRAVGCGEKPFFDPSSKSRREALDLYSYNS